MKGSVIADGSVVGAGAVVSGHYSEENVIIAGNPAKIIKKQIFWKEVRADNYPVQDMFKKKREEENTKL